MSCGDRSWITAASRASDPQDADRNLPSRETHEPLDYR